MRRWHERIVRTALALALGGGVAYAVEPHADADAHSPTNTSGATSQESPKDGGGDSGHSAGKAKPKPVAGLDNTTSGGGKKSGVLEAPAARANLPPSPAPATGDPDNGGELARTGVTEKGAPPCVSCHGLHGEGNVATGFPRIAGLPAEYLAKQLDDYATGRRVQPIMSPIAKGLDAQQRRDVAAFYAAAPPTTLPQALQWARPREPVTAEALQRASALARVGDAQLRVQACANCHGPDGVGLRPIYPALAGQSAVYLKTALDEWRDGTRHNDPSGQMPEVAKALRESDAAALARLYAAMPPPTLTSP